jgi:hypothetical protein
VNIYLEDIKRLACVELGFSVVIERNGKMVSPAECLHSFCLMRTKMKIESGSKSIAAAVFVAVLIDEPEGYSLRCWVEIKQPTPNGSRGVLDGVHW